MYIEEKKKLPAALQKYADEMKAKGGKIGEKEKGTKSDKELKAEAFLASIGLRSTVLDEGFIRAQVGAALQSYSSAGTEIAGWFKGITEKNRAIQEKCDDLVEWLRDEDKANPDLKLTMGSFYTWMKTSETYMWRYYFLLNDSMYNKILKDISADGRTSLEDMFDLDLQKRKDTAKMLDNVLTIKGLIEVVQKYKTRADNFAKAILKRKTSINGAPFQVVLLGFTDLDMTVKKIVRLAK